MITHINVKRFKKLPEIDIDLDETVVLVGPNNSGKTSLLQAVSLWYVGIQHWYEQRIASQSKAKQRTGVVINRNALLNIPVPHSKLLWQNQHVQEKGNKRVRILVNCQGETDNQKWSLGFEFDYNNKESIYCRIVSNSTRKTSTQDFPEILLKEKVGFLPPMSGLSTMEEKLDDGGIYRRLGEGQSAQVLRNLCYKLYINNPDKWNLLVNRINGIFKVRLQPPELSLLTSLLTLSYEDEHGKTLDVSSSGRGMQQVLLILAFMLSTDHSIVLMDEPDAHLEILRQREIYQNISEMLKESNSQLIVATHSETLLNEAAEKDQIIAFVGCPHVLNSKQQLIKALNKIGVSDYLLAKEKKWILYLEGSTDLDLLKAFAKKLEHPVMKYLDSPFVRYLSTNRPQDARDHFYGLLEAEPKLKGVALFDHLDKELNYNKRLIESMWERNEFENYIPLPSSLYRFIEEQGSKTLFEAHYPEILKKIVEDNTAPAALKDSQHDFWVNTKISQYLETIFRKFSEKTDTKIISKGRFYSLIRFSTIEELNMEIKQKLDLIREVAKAAEK